MIVKPRSTIPIYPRKGTNRALYIGLATGRNQKLFTKKANAFALRSSVVRSKYNQRIAGRPHRQAPPSPPPGIRHGVKTPRPEPSRLSARPGHRTDRNLPHHDRSENQRAPCGAQEPKSIVEVRAIMLGHCRHRRISPCIFGDRLRA